MQPLLIDVEPDLQLVGCGSVRARTGILAEGIVSGLLGLRPGGGGNAIYTPDAYKGKGESKPVEIKSVNVTSGLRGKTVVYDFRLAKDAKHAPSLAYTILCYQKKDWTGEKQSIKKVIKHFQTSSLVLLVVPGWRIREAALREPLRLFNVLTTCAGNRRPGYCEGYRNLPIYPFLKQAVKHELKTFHRWGHDFSALVAYTDLDPWCQKPLDKITL